MAVVCVEPVRSHERLRRLIKHSGMIACISLVLGNVALAEEAPPTDCDTYAASNVDPQRKAEGVPPNEVDFAKAIPACLDALSHDPNSARFQYQLGRAYDKSGDYQQALAWYRKAAEQGYAAAENNLGNMYNEGHGVPKDDAQGVSWIRKAAERGFAVAQNNLGYSYLEGGGVAKDAVQAATWYRKAAEQGFAMAQNSLGYLYQRGIGVAKDAVQAATWYRKAAEQGYAASQNSLGYLYQQGVGVAKDYVQAASWYRKAAEQGHVQAQLNLGIMYINGVGVPKDDLQAFAWTQKAAAQGNAQAQFNLGTMYDYGEGVTKDETQGFNWICRSAEKGDLAGQFNLGRRYLKGVGVKQNDIIAYMWFNLAAAHGEKDAAMIRDTMARSMRPAQIAEAQRLTREWKPSSGDTSCNLAAAEDFTCKGMLLDQRRVGISLGDCDLNSLPASELKKITDICGQPIGVGENTNKTCYVRGVVGLRKTSGTQVIERVLAIKAGGG
jgi:TPR repeat protein